MMEYDWNNIESRLNQKIDELFNSHSYSKKIKEAFKLVMYNYVMYYGNKGIKLFEEFCKEEEIKMKKSVFRPIINPYLIERKKEEFNSLNQQIDKILLTKLDRNFKIVENLIKEQELEEQRIKIKEEAKIRRKGHSNIKPISFYKEMYNYGDEEDEERVKSQQEHDTYFEEQGIPKDKWELKRKHSKGMPFIHNTPKLYVSADTSEENQKHLNRCREIINILIDLSKYLNKDKTYQFYLHDIGILQRYLTEGYLITRQINWFPDMLNDMLNTELTRIPDKPFSHIKNHPVSTYYIDIYSDDYNIDKINEKIDEFVAITNKFILTPIAEIKKYLKEHDNQISIVDYAGLKQITPKKARRILTNFVKEKKLKSKKVGSSHKFIFYV